MVTVPDDLNRQNTRIILNLDQSLKRPLHFLVLFVDILGSNLPVGFRLGQICLVDPSATLISKVSMDIIAGPADDDEDGKCWTALQPVFSFHLVDELPHLMIDRAQPLSPLQSGVY